MITHHTLVHENFKQLMQGFRYDAHPMGMFVSAIAALSTFYPEANRVHDPEVRLAQVHRLIAKVPTIAAFSYRHNLGLPYVYPENERGFVSNFLSMMFRMAEPSYTADPVLERALEVLFILHADHEQNCSANAIRSIGSSLVDPYSALAGAAAALYGPLHGGANEEVLKMLAEIGDVRRVPDFIAQVKAGERRLMGFGHRVYKNYDPRAKIIKQVADEVFEITGRNPLLDIALELEHVALEDDYFVSRKLYPNVDFYSGMIYQALGLAGRDVPGHVRDPAHRGLARAVDRAAQRPRAEDRAAAPALRRARASATTRRSPRWPRGRARRRPVERRREPVASARCARSSRRSRARDSGSRTSPRPSSGINDVLIRVHKTGICGTDLHIHRWDAWARETVPVPMVDRPRVRRRGGRARLERQRLLARRPRQRRGARGLRPLPQLHGRAPPPLRPHDRPRRAAAGSLRRVRRAADDEHLAALAGRRRGDRRDLRPVRKRGAHGAQLLGARRGRARSPAPARSACMATAVVRHAGARHVVVTDVNAYRLELARRMGATRRLDPRERELADVQRELGMPEGFDVGARDVGHPPRRCASMIASMAHGGRIAVLGIPSEQVALDLDPVVFNMLTLKGIYGREMYETWYQMTRDARTPGLDISPVVTHRFAYRDFERGLRRRRLGRSRAR